MTEIEPNEVLDVIKRRTRRKLAVGSFSVMVAMVVGVFFKADLSTAQSNLLEVAMITFAGVIGAYMGTAIFDDRWRPTKRDTGRAVRGSADRVSGRMGDDIWERES
jgi:hypothetical protein